MFEKRVKKKKKFVNLNSFDYKVMFFLSSSANLFLFKSVISHINFRPLKPDTMNIRSLSYFIDAIFNANSITFLLFTCWTLRIIHVTHVGS